MITMQGIDKAICSTMPMFFWWFLLSSLVGCASYWVSKKTLVALFGRRINLSYTDPDGVKQMRKIRIKRRK